MTFLGVISADENVVADAVFCADGSYDEQNKDAFKRMVSERQRQLLATKKAKEIMRNALADTKSEHPAATVIAELSKVAADAIARKQNSRYDPEQSQQMYLRNIQNVKDIQSEEKGTERERLTQCVEEQEKRVELMMPHCHLEVALNK